MFLWGKIWTMEELENFAAQQDGYLGWVGVRISPDAISSFFL